MAPDPAAPADLKDAYRAMSREDVSGKHLSDEVFERLACDELNPFERQSAIDHVVSCEDCGRLWRGLSEMRREARAFDPGVPQRRSASTVWRSRPGFLVTALAAGLILAVTGTVVYQWQRRPPATSTTPPSTTAAAPPPAPRWVSALTLAKADIHVSPDDALAFRGAADTLEPSAVDLAAALAPYRQDDFAEAAGRLRPLLDRYPRSPRVGLYLGVSLLFLGRHEDAVGPLEVGLTATDPAVANDARWFLVVAYARAGRLDLAEPRLRALCAAAVDRARPACAALGAGQEQGPR